MQTRVQGPAADTGMRPLSLDNLITVSLIDKIILDDNCSRDFVRFIVIQLTA